MYDPISLNEGLRNMRARINGHTRPSSLNGISELPFEHAFPLYVERWLDSNPDISIVRRAEGRDSETGEAIFGKISFLSPDTVYTHRSISYKYGVLIKPDLNPRVFPYGELREVRDEKKREIETRFGGLICVTNTRTSINKRFIGNTSNTPGVIFANASLTREQFDTMRRRKPPIEKP